MCARIQRSAALTRVFVRLFTMLAGPERVLLVDRVDVAIQVLARQSSVRMLISLQLALAVSACQRLVAARTRAAATGSRISSRLAYPVASMAHCVGVPSTPNRAALSAGPAQIGAAVGKSPRVAFMSSTERFANFSALQVRTSDELGLQRLVDPRPLAAQHVPVSMHHLLAARPCRCSQRFRRLLCNMRSPFTICRSR